MYPKERVCVVNKISLWGYFTKPSHPIDKFSELKVLNLSKHWKSYKRKYNNVQKYSSNTLRIEGYIPVLLDAGKRYLGEKLKAYTQMFK